MSAPMTRAQLEQAATRIAKQYRLPPEVFKSLITQESGWQIHVGSPAGARGLTQLMPATARGLGVNPDDPIQNMEGGARYLRSQLDRFGSMRLALAAYNAGPNAVAKYGDVPPYKETQRYVSTILSNSHTKSQAPSDQKAPTSSLATPVGLTAAPPGLATPTSDPLTDQVFQNLGDIGKGESPTFALSKLTGLTPSAAPATATPAPVLPVQQIPKAPTREAVAPNLTHGASGQISIAQGANRAGVKIKQDIIDFAKRVAAQWGHELTITTGTNHNQYVAGEGHTQSAHWTGEAVDIAVNHNGPGHVDPKLTALGQAALIAAGMAPAEARKQHGGVYNLNGYQVLFNTSVGGNHWNHLHLGIRG